MGGGARARVPPLVCALGHHDAYIVPMAMGKMCILARPLNVAQTVQFFVGLLLMRYGTGATLTIPRRGWSAVGGSGRSQLKSG